jgi:hypothetical protein
VDDQRPPSPGWVAPETTIDGAPPVRGQATNAVTTSRDVAELGPQVPLALRPFTAADVLDGAFAVLRTAPGKVIAVAAVFGVPIQLAVAFTQRGVLGGFGLVELFSTDPSADVVAAAEDDGGAGAAWGALLAVVGPSIVLPFVAAALAALIAAWYAGRDITLGEALAAAGRGWWALLASWVLVHLVEGVAAIACIVPMLFVMPLYVCVAPAIAVERLGAIAAMRRSWRLGRRRYWPTFGMALLTGVVAYALTQSLPALPTGLALLIGLDVGWILLGIGNALTALIVLPMVAASAVLIYLDLRVRTEGLDLELDVVRVFAPAQ